MTTYKFESARGRIFLDYLNTVYSSKQFLLTFLPEIEHYATNNNLKLAIDEFGDDNQKQLTNLHMLYVTIKQTFVTKDIVSMRVIALEAYLAAISETIETMERDCSIVFFLQAIDLMEALYLKNLWQMTQYFGVGFQNIKVPLDYALDNIRLFDDVHKELLQ